MITDLTAIECPMAVSPAGIVAGGYGLGRVRGGGVRWAAAGPGPPADGRVTVGFKLESTEI